MLGTFNNDQPTIEIEVGGVTGVKKKLVALVDSGFNGYLQIPYIEAFPLGLILAGVQQNTFANGSSSSHLVCKGTVCIDGQCLDTTIDIEAGNMILIGTKLLKELGKVFILDCSSGHVEIVSGVKQKKE